MKPMHAQAHLARPRAECGMALITGMLMLMVVTIIALSMFRSYGMQEKIAGNTREKDRALNAAISAQQLAESWLVSGTAPTTGGVCTAGLVSSNVGQVCTNTPDNGFAAPWTIGGVGPTGVRDDNFAGQTVSANPTQATWYQQPQYYVTWLAGVPGGNTYYQIDAAGWGGTPNSVAVVESTYEVFPPGAGGPPGGGGTTGGSLDK
jgi:type IV pilus assembly protein PilX